MKKKFIKPITILFAFPILIFYALSGNGKFDWDKTILKIERFFLKSKS